jgi:Fe-S cluster biogenesis protein NfuA
MFIQTEETPNPATLKFMPEKVVMVSGTADFPSPEFAYRSRLAENLFKISGVKGAFFGKDFITVTKEESLPWSVLKPPILSTIMDYFTVHDSVSIQEHSNFSSKEELSEIEQEIKALLEKRIRPAVAMDGGDIVFEKFENGIVYLQMQGACSGCPSSSATLKSGIENMLKHYIPEVEEVRAI